MLLHCVNLNKLVRCTNWDNQYGQIDMSHSPRLLVFFIYYLLLSIVLNNI